MAAAGAGDLMRVPPGAPCMYLIEIVEGRLSRGPPSPEGRPADRATVANERGFGTALKNALTTSIERS
jgi:hypothetical protein